MTSTTTISDLIKNIQLLSEADFEDFFSKIMTLRKTSSAGKLSLKELSILQEINAGLPREKQMRFDLLIAKRDTDTISKKEMQELLELTKEVELYDLKRLQLISELANIRKLGLPEIVEVFNIKPHHPHV
ncbi:MAG TPA: hypothetical protein ENJ95_07885 [Bacteroidetes bacterium]|nr:hypothetical protein [Bacteroidota bacterium]